MKYKCIVCEDIVDNNDTMSNTNVFNLGYGSRFDLNKFDLSICDNCIEDKIVKGIIHLTETEVNF